MPTQCNYVWNGISWTFSSCNCPGGCALCSPAGLPPGTFIGEPASTPCAGQ